MAKKTKMGTPSPPTTFIISWTCECGHTAVEEFTGDTRREAGAGVVKQATLAGFEHQQGEGCPLGLAPEEGGVFIYGRREVKESNHV